MTHMREISARVTKLRVMTEGRQKFLLSKKAIIAIIQWMKQWIVEYLKAQKAAHDSIPIAAVVELIETVRQALEEDRQLFIFGNGGSAANASHFATDLGKGASDKMGRRFRVLSLNDNVSWLTALGNDYAYEDVFVRQLMNYARPGDLAFALSVSGNSPNVVKALEWAAKNGLTTIALVGGKRGRLADVAQRVIVIDSEHYGRVEDAHMGICHMLCYAFIENPDLGKG
jgi:D-sedoheptulose 7-phosphate isomerase